MDEDEDNSDALAEIERQKLIDAFEAETGKKWTPEREREVFRDIAKPDFAEFMDRRDIIATRRFDRLKGHYAPPLEDALPRFMREAKALKATPVKRKKRGPSPTTLEAAVRALQSFSGKEDVLEIKADALTWHFPKFKRGTLYKAQQLIRERRNSEYSEQQ
jgi:hypothetical protein